MNCIIQKSRRELVNKFAELILNKINDGKNLLTHIEVTDFMNFFVIKGETESKEVIDINQIKQSFFDEYKDVFQRYSVKNFNIIDLIKYNVLPVPKNEYYFQFYNSERPIYNPEVIEYYSDTENLIDGLSSVNFTDKLELEYNWPIYMMETNDNFTYTSQMTISSEFPYGYSLKMGKSHLYYSEYISNQLFKVIKTDKLIFKITNQVVDDDNNQSDLKIMVKSESMYENKLIESMVLDVFDFNLGKFTNEYLKGYNFDEEINKPFDKKPWLVYDKVKDMIII